MAPDEDMAVSPSKETETLTASSGSSSANVDLPAEKASSSWRCLFAFTTLSHAGPLIAAIFSAALSAAFRTVFAIVLGNIFDIVAEFGEGLQSGSGMTSRVSSWSLVLVFLGAGNWLANTAFLATWIIFGEMQAKAVRTRIFFRLLSQDMAWFDSLEHGVSSLLVRIQTQTRELQLATSQVLGSLICNAMVSIASLAVAFSYSWKLTLVLLATIPVSMLIISFATRKLEPAIQAQKQHLQTASKLSTASINAIDLVKVFNGFDNELRQYFQAIGLAGKHYLTQARCNAFQMGFVGSWLISLFLVGFLYGVVLVKQGMKPGNVLTTFYATLAAFQGIEAMLPHWLVLSKGMAAGQFLSSMASESDESNELQPNGSLKLVPCIGNVEMTNVSFAYPSNPSKIVLNTSSFFFPAGEMSFIVGRSGSGKSTIGSLLARFYEPLTGTIWLDGQSLSSFDEHWIQSHITLIQQSSILFNDTVFNNIALGHTDVGKATQEEIVSASEFALLQSTLRALPDGLGTTIGTNGHKLSGGQRQRLALARARLRDPSVLILDEVTSSLDQISRTLIMDAIRDWRRGKTTIIITHDVNQIHDDDLVHVLEDGNLVEKGFRRDLMQVQDPFASMDSQSHTDPSLPIHDEVEQQVEMQDSPRYSEKRHFPAESSQKQPMAYEQEHPRVSADFDDSFVSDDTNDSILDMKDAEFLFGASERRENIPQLRSSSTRERLALAQEQSIKGPPRGSLWTTLATLWPTLGSSDRALFVLGLIICIIGAASTAAFSFCFAKLLGAMWSAGNKLEEGKKWAIFLAVVAVVDGLSTFFGHYLLEKVAQSWVNSIRSEAMRRILRQPKAWFDREDNSASRVSECLERNSEEMRNVVGRFIPIIMSAVSVLVISMTWAMAISWELTLVALSPLPVVIAALKAYTFTSKKWETKCNKGAEEASALLNEIFVNVKVVRALTLEAHFESKYKKLVSRALGMGLRRAAYTCGLYGLYESISYPLMALVYYYATSLLAKKSDFTTTEVVQVVNLLLFSIGNATNLLSSLPQLTMAQATATQLLGYARLPLEAPPGESLEWRTQVESSLPIEARDLTFAYSQNPHEQVLRGISFNLEPGSCTAIVGPSGCGKSTIVSLLLGLYAPTNANQLSFAHVPHSQLDTQHLRSKMAYVSQSPFLFPATVTENIAYGLPPSSPFRDTSNIHAAAQAAGIHDFIISLPQGYATPLGEGGLSLSGGQAQRMSIARALVRHPQLLIMDEPTSALDGESSATLRETISSLAQRCKGAAGADEGGMAIVLVTHSRDMMQVAGNIIMIDAGVKVEEGGYEDLLLAGGRFRHLISGGEWKGL